MGIESHKTKYVGAHSRLDQIENVIGIGLLYMTYRNAAHRVLLPRKRMNTFLIHRSDRWLWQLGHHLAVHIHTHIHHALISLGLVWLVLFQALK